MILELLFVARARALSVESLTGVKVSRIRFVVLYSGCSCQSSSRRKFVGTSRRSKTSLERGPTKSETAVAAVIVGSEGFFISNSSTSRFPIFAAMRSRVSLGRPSSKMVRAISSSVRYQVCLLRTLVAERETFLSTALKESARLWKARSFEAAETRTVAENHASR